MANPRLNDQSDKKEEHTMTSSQPPLTPEQIAELIVSDDAGTAENGWAYWRNLHSCGYGCCGGGVEIDREVLMRLIADALRTAESQGEARGRRLALERAAAQINDSESEPWTREEVRDWLLFRVQESQGSPGTTARADAKGSAPIEAWLPIESAPKDKTYRLLRCGSPQWKPGAVIGNWFAFSNRKDDGFWEAHGTQVEPTHWAPLPAPPKAEATS
jgi:hypothetical protein